MSTLNKKIFFLFFLVLSACGNHSTQSQSFLKPSAVAKGEADTIFTAIDQDNAPLFEQKISEITDINMVFDDGNTLLTYATEKNKPFFVGLLIKKGADPMLANKNGSSALQIAQQNGNTAILLILDPEGQTLIEQENLFQAVVAKAPAKITALLNLGINPNFLHSSGETPLTVAAKKKFVGCVQVLAYWETIDINMPNAEGKTALAIAQELKANGIIKILKEKGAQ